MKAPRPAEAMPFLVEGEARNGTRVGLCCTVHAVFVIQVDEVRSIDLAENSESLGKTSKMERQDVKMHGLHGLHLFFYNVFFCPFLVVTSHWQGHVTSSLFILESVRLLIKFLLKKLLSKKKLIQIRKQDKSDLDTFRLKLQSLLIPLGVSKLSRRVPGSKIVFKKKGRHITVYHCIIPRCFGVRCLCLLMMRVRFVVRYFMCA